jgi:hypothetical protein
MGTPSTISRNALRRAFVPVRRDEIALLAAAVHKKFANTSLDDIAEREGIIFLRVPDEHTFKAGFSCILGSPEPKKLQSSAIPGENVFSFSERSRSSYPAIIINSAKTICEAEVFWHEYYHLFYSPSRTGSATFFDGYLTAGVLDKQEERRANLFAAHMLMPSVEKSDTIEMLVEKFGVSAELAKLRIATA